MDNNSFGGAPDNAPESSGSFMGMGQPGSGGQHQAHHQPHGQHHEQHHQPHHEQPHQQGYPSPQPQHSWQPQEQSNGVVGGWSGHMPGQRNKGGFFRSIAYLPEYFVMLVLLLTLVGAVTSLIGIGVDSLIKAEESAGASNPYLGNIDSLQLVWSLAALLASLPIFAWLFVRTRNTEAEAPAVKQHRWRKGFLGVFLVIEGLTAVWTLGAFFYDLLGRAIGGEGGVMSLFSAGADPWWQEFIVTLVSIAVLVMVIFVMSRDYRAKVAEQA